MLLLRLDSGLVLAAPLNDATIMPVGKREDVVKDVVTDVEPMQLPPLVPLASVAVEGWQAPVSPPTRLSACT
jgi:hypothetical protein